MPRTMMWKMDLSPYLRTLSLFCIFQELTSTPIPNPYNQSNVGLLPIKKFQINFISVDFMVVVYSRGKLCGRDDVLTKSKQCINIKMQCFTSMKYILREGENIYIP
jgi:hypothetical protein